MDRLKALFTKNLVSKFKEEGSKGKRDIIARMAISIILLCMILVNLSGCAQTMHAIEHSKMTVVAKMSDTIFIDPQILAKNRNVFVRVTNTSDMQEIAFEGILIERLRQRGLNIVSDPSRAGYIIQANVLYMDYEKQGLTADGMLAGGFGGALAGSTFGSGTRGPAAGMVAGSIIGSVVGSLVGSLIHVDTYVGIIDVQIQERVEGGVRGTMTTDASQGSVTRFQTEREIKSDFQTYRTRIVAKAKQTNIDKQEAARVISDKLAAQIAGMF